MLLLLALACTPAPDDGSAAPGRPADTDTGVADTGSTDTDADTGTPDTDADTGTPDTGADTDADTGTPDTGADTGVDTGPAPDPVPAFSLVDQNPASPRYDELVSPRDYLERVSGWYFIHAT